MGRERQAPRAPTTRPRRLRIAAAGFSLVVTLVAVLGATGVLAIDGTAEPAYAGTVRAPDGSATSVVVPPATLSPVSGSLPLSPQLWFPVPDNPGAPETAESPELPERSGDGKRIVFDISDQRVWLVSARDNVRRTYLVSGSLTDNLGPGAYEVFSKSMDAVGIDDSGTMRYMVRFTQGVNAAIGFHDIPVREGEKVQSRRMLGTPQSHGCIRQLRKDAKALWEFAPVGTAVVVVA